MHNQWKIAAVQRSFLAFLQASMGTVSPGVRYAHNWHIGLIAEYLQACVRGEITRLIINMPPRMLKSLTVSVAWPAWLLAHHPTERIMAASYAQSLSVKHSLDCRLVMQSAWYKRAFPGTVLSEDQNEKDKFVTTVRGHRMAVSVGSAATGEGGNFLIVDDPLSALQATQKTLRDQANAWFDHTFSTRLDDKKRGVMVVVMQRLHKEDLSGYLLQRGGFEHVCLPAIAERAEKFSIGSFTHMRKPGEALHPAREDVALIARAKLELGSANFAAQYQQAPQSHQGSMIKLEWFGRYDG